MTILLLAGLAAGLLHVLSGPDHLAAIAPIAVKKPRGAWRAGLRWGFGHASGVIAVGIVSLLLRGELPVNLISDWSDRLVGVLLIGIGLWAIRKALQVHTHEHEHGHDEHVHIHIHGKKAHADPEAHRELLFNWDVPSIGGALPGTEVIVVDGEGRSLPAGERGELCIRGPSRMIASYQDPETTGKTVIDIGVNTRHRTLLFA